MLKSPKQILNVLGFGTAISLLGDATLYTVLPNPTIAAQVGVSLAMVGILLGANRAIRLLLNGPMGIIGRQTAQARPAACRFKSGNSGKSELCAA